MTQPPGTLHPIPDPQAEMERLAQARKDPPGRRWGVRHPDGRITVHVTGQPFLSRSDAERERIAFEADCGECAGGDHSLVYYELPAWRSE